MAWWAWLLLAWLPVAALSAVWMGLAIRLAEQREGICRGRPGPAGQPTQLSGTAGR
jgi:hypothetical protein